jgi:hypothetical protein
MCCSKLAVLCKWNHPYPSLHTYVSEGASTRVEIAEGSFIIRGPRGSVTLYNHAELTVCPLLHVVTVTLPACTRLSFIQQQYWDNNGYGVIPTGENRITARKRCHNATLSTTNPTWTVPGSNPDICGKRPALIYWGMSWISQHHNATANGAMWVCSPFHNYMTVCNPSHNYMKVCSPSHNYITVCSPSQNYITVCSPSHNYITVFSPSHN